jgi:hypothetical protein
MAYVLVVGCDEPPPPAPEPPPPPPPPRREVAAPRAVTTGAAFDLVLGPRGPVLIYAEPAPVGGAIQLLTLDRHGAAVGAPRVVYRPIPEDDAVFPPDALEISAASGGGQLAVAWVERHGTSFRALATHGAADGAFAPPIELGATQRELASTRGHVAAAVSPAGHVEVMARLAPAPCVDPSGAGASATGAAPPTTCVPVGITRLAPGPNERRGVGLMLPRPCASTVLGFVHATDVWHYAVCDESEGLATTFYAVQFDPQYAHAERALEGCEPRGMVGIGDGVAAVGDCDGTRRALWLGAAGRERRMLEGTAHVSCEGGEARLVLPDGTSEALTGPRGGFAALLSDEVAPRGSRAVWTGDVLLVAAPIDREVGVRRHECWDGGLRRTDHE